MSRASNILGNFNAVGQRKTYTKRQNVITIFNTDDDV